MFYIASAVPGASVEYICCGYQSDGQFELLGTAVVVLVVDSSAHDRTLCDGLSYMRKNKGNLAAIRVVMRRHEILDSSQPEAPIQCSEAHEIKFSFTDNNTCNCFMIYITLW